MAYITELLCRELSGPDIIFLRNSSEVLIALSLETTTEARKVRTFLSLLISLTEKLEKNAMLSKKSISSISLKEIKGMLESGKKGKTTFSDSLREKLYNLVNFKFYNIYFYLYHCFHILDLICNDPHHSYIFRCF